MLVSKNRKERTYSVVSNKDNFNVSYSVPFPRAKRASNLTIKVGNKYVNLPGRHVRTLVSVLNKGLELSV